MADTIEQVKAPSTIATLRDVLLRVVAEDATNDMTVRQLCVLANLFRGSRTVRDLAAQTAIAKPSISRAADRLEALGFALRQDDPADRRSILLVITPAGKRFLTAVTQI